MRKWWCKRFWEGGSISQCVRRDVNMFLANCFLVVADSELDTSASALSGELRTLDLQILNSFLCTSNGFMDLSRQKNV